MAMLLALLSTALNLLVVSPGAIVSDPSQLEPDLSPTRDGSNANQFRKWMRRQAYVINSKGVPSATIPTLLRQQPTLTTQAILMRTSLQPNSITNDTTVPSATRNDTTSTAHNSTEDKPMVHDVEHRLSRLTFVSIFLSGAFASVFVLVVHFKDAFNSRRTVEGIPASAILETPTSTGGGGVVRYRDRYGKWQPGSSGDALPTETSTTDSQQWKEQVHTERFKDDADTDLSTAGMCAGVDSNKALQVEERVDVFLLAGTEDNTSYQGNRIPLPNIDKDLPQNKQAAQIKEEDAIVENASAENQQKGTK